MSINYKKAYLTDGTQVKVTEELLGQLREWENEGYTFHFSYIDLLKMQDNEMINKDRVFYTHNTSLEGETEKENSNPMLLHDERANLEVMIIDNERDAFILHALELCTPVQRRRFVKNYYLNYSLTEIAGQEFCSVAAVHYSVKAVEKILINYEQL